MEALSPRSRGRRELRANLLVGLCCLLVYNANLRTIAAGDTYPARYLPFAIWQHHSLHLDPIATMAAQGRALSGAQGRDPAFWMVRGRGDHLVSLYPVILPVLVAPFYLPAVGYLHLRDWNDWRVDHVARVMEKLAASSIAAMSAALLYLLLRRRTSPGIALLLTLAYAFGTTTWVISSQALWQHGLAQLLVVGLLLLLTAECTARRALAAGLLCGLLAATRPPDVVLAAALGVFALHWAGRRRTALLAAAALPVALVLLYNVGIAGRLLGGYGVSGDASFFRHDPLSGLAGLLVSPTHGLLVFSPFLLFLVLAWRHAPRDIEERRLTWAIGAGVVLQLLLYSFTDWRGGASWGPRYLTDLLPLLIWMLVPVVGALRRLGRAGFGLAVGVAIVIEAIGAFGYSGAADGAILAVSGGPDQMRAAWAWRNAPFVALERGLAPRELTIEVRGSLDAIEADGRAASAVPAGQEAQVSGWALAGKATPWKVAVAVDGKFYSTRTFFDRADVRRALGVESPAGWRIPLDTTGLAPGEHTLTALAWVWEFGEGYCLAGRKLTVAPASVAGRSEGQRPAPAVASLVADPAPVADLDAAFRTARTRLLADQQTSGAWHTSFTSAPRFDAPRPEMNTFTTALLVDLLDPIAGRAGLDDSVARARRHLTDQIEPGGLVRYHGRPDGPGIGTLGCVITPDADDTALVWRLAPGPDRAQLAAALATLDRYRTGAGLYRTWLAPREAYQCLDPGRDPNPTDLAIQMHVFMLLAEARPTAGRALCAALRPVVDDDRVWAYYRLTPLVPMLRLAEVRRAGCALDLPEYRMQARVPGQEIWVAAVRLMQRARMPEGRPPDPAEIRSILRRIADQDFALLQTSPPLLYHNDLTAGTPRYYWSADAGYALWLRLADEAARRGQAGPERSGHGASEP